MKKKPKNAILSAILNVVLRCDRIFFWGKPEQRKCDCKLKERLPGWLNQHILNHMLLRKEEI